MATNEKTSELTVAGALDGTEIVPVVKGGSTVQTTAQAIGDLGGGGSAGDPSYGQIYVSASALTTISAINTPTKIAGTYTANLLKDFTHATGRMTYTGTATKTFLITFHSYITTSTSNSYNITLAKNGTSIADPHMQFTQVQNRLPSHSTMVSLATNDYIEAFVENKSADTDITFARLVFTAIEVVSTAATSDYGEVTMDDNATNTTISIQDTAVLVAGTTVAGVTSSNVTASTAGRLTYTAATARDFKVTATISHTKIGAGSQQFEFFIAKNGTIETKTRQATSFANTALGPTSLSGIINLAQNDYVEVFVANTGSTDDVRINNIQLTMVAL
jgi:hypothetical protein